MLLENRVIALLDVLGMSQHIDSNGIQDTLKKYNAILAEANEEVLITKTLGTIPGGRKGKIAKHLQVTEFVFDTLVLVSFPLTKGSIFSFVHATNHLMALFAEKDMPLRGTLGIGDYIFDDDTGIFLSNIFKDLSNLEHKQEWTGCVILPSASQEILNGIYGDSVPMPNKYLPVIKYNVPTKSGNEEHWCLNWMNIMGRKEKELLFQYLNTNPKKKDNTMEYYNYCQSLPGAKMKLPEEFYPAKYAIVINSIAGSSFAFMNENDEHIRMGCQTFAYNPAIEDSEKAFIGYNNQHEYRRLEIERWKN